MVLENTTSPLGGRARDGGGPQFTTAKKIGWYKMVNHQDSLSSYSSIVKIERQIHAQFVAFSF